MKYTVFLEGLAELHSKVEVVDAHEKSRFEIFLYKCLAPIPFRKYRRRKAYLKIAIPKGFSKKLLFF